MVAYQFGTIVYVSLVWYRFPSLSMVPGADACVDTAAQGSTPHLILLPLQLSPERHRVPTLARKWNTSLIVLVPLVSNSLWSYSAGNASCKKKCSCSHTFRTKLTVQVDDSEMNQKGKHGVFPQVSADLWEMSILTAAQRTV